jgi:hypothetical protein
MMHRFRFLAFLLAGVLCPQPALLDAQGAETRSKPESKRPALSVKASPTSGMAPIRVSLTGELKGGPDDDAEFYCSAVEWTWGDGTVSESSADCDPFEPGKSAIQRRYSIQHVYQLAGRFQVQLRLKKKGKTVATATTAVQILGVYGRGEP